MRPYSPYGFLLFLMAVSAFIFTACSTELPYQSRQLQDVPYLLSSGDVVKVMAAQGQNINGEFTLDDNGDVDLPLIGRVNLKGLTIAQSDQLITELYSNGYLVNPDITVQLDSYRPFYIMGEVQNPGKYEYRDGLTVLNAVAIAGGFTYRANQEEFELVRVPHPDEADRAEKKTVEGLSTALFPGDTIYVKERLF